MSDHQPGPTVRFLRKLAVELSIMTLVGIVLALIGPFGSAADPLPARLVSWITLCWVGYAIYGPMRVMVDVLEQKLQLPRGPLWVAVTLFATVPMTAAIWLMQASANGLQPPSMQAAFEAYINVLVIGGSITVLFQLIARANREPALGAKPAGAWGGVPGALHKPAEPEPARQPVPQPRFVDRLPAELGTQLIALEMEDHYVRAHTALGSDLLLMRMRDAVADLDGVEGMQVHRSWWVARGAVYDVRREGRNVRLLLEGGLEAPVSRANVSALKDAGWI